MLLFDSRVYARPFFWGLVTWLSLASLPAGAFSYLVSPIRADLGVKQRSTQVTVKSSSTRPVLIRVHLYSWTKVEGKDHLAPASGVLVTPPLLRLEPNQSQVVRLGLLSPRPPNAPEAQYRVEFEEVDGGDVDVNAPAPKVDEKPALGMQINTLTNISIPFIVHGDKTVKSLNGTARWAPEGSNLADADDNTPPLAGAATKRPFWVEVTNTGDTIQQIARLTLLGPDNQALAEPIAFVYVLPGQMSRIEFALPLGSLPERLSLGYREGYTDAVLPLSYTDH